MTIYAATATEKGRRFYQSENADKLSVRRVVVLGILQGKGWHDMRTILSRLEEAYDRYSTMPDVQDITNTLFGYAKNYEEITNDLRGLETIEYIEIARYRYKDGRLATNAPVGMVFR